MAEPPSLKRATLAQVVADALREALCEGQYLCGERLVESSIAREIGVSQNTVRDALRLLEREAWVEYRARRGVIVRKFDVDEAEEIYALWASVEAVAFRWAVAAISRADLLAALRPPLERARMASAEGAWGEVRAGIFGFHRALAALPGRPRTFELLSRLYNQAVLLDVDHAHRTERTADAYTAWVAGYDHLLGVIKFGVTDDAWRALEARIAENGRPIIRRLALHA